MINENFKEMKCDHSKHGNESYHKHTPKKIDLYDLHTVWNCFEWFEMIIIFGGQDWLEKLIIVHFFWWPLPPSSKVFNYSKLYPTPRCVNPTNDDLITMNTPTTINAPLINTQPNPMNSTNFGIYSNSKRESRAIFYKYK